MSDGLQDVIVLDLETARLSTWCRVCGEVALVANHCLADVRLTKRLFELTMRQGFLERDHGLRIKIPRPAGLPDWWHSDIRRDD